MADAGEALCNSALATAVGESNGESSIVPEEDTADQCFEFGSLKPISHHSHCRLHVSTEPGSLREQGAVCSAFKALLQCLAEVQCCDHLHQGHLAIHLEYKA